MDEPRHGGVIDECGSNIGLTPLYVRASTGLRAYGSVPRNRGKNTTLIAALTFEGMGESMIIEGAANAAAFERSIEEILSPSLTVGQIVIMDNRPPIKVGKQQVYVRATSFYGQGQDQDLMLVHQERRYLGLLTIPVRWRHAYVDPRKLTDEV